jgi:hypothetical protein
MQQKNISEKYKVYLFRSVAKYCTFGLIMKHKGLFSLFSIAMLILMVSQCAPLPCVEETDAKVKANFFTTGTGTAITADSVTLYGLGMDTSKVYDKATNLKSISFPLNSATDSCTFFIKLNNLTDTVTFYYTNYTRLISKECGYTFYHSLDSIKHKKEVLDYNIINRNITTVNEENIRIFY